MTSKRRRFDVILVLSLRRVPVGMTSSWNEDGRVERRYETEKIVSHEEVWAELRQKWVHGRTEERWKTGSMRENHRKTYGDSFLTFYDSSLSTSRGILSSDQSISWLEEKISRVQKWVLKTGQQIHNNNVIITANVAGIYINSLSPGLCDCNHKM